MKLRNNTSFPVITTKTPARPRLRSEQAFTDLAKMARRLPHHTPRPKRLLADPFEPAHRAPIAYRRAATLPKGEQIFDDGQKPVAVRYGNVFVMQPIVADYEAVRGYMLATPGGRAYLRRFEHPESARRFVHGFSRGDSISILGHTMKAETGFIAPLQRIYWDPCEALVNSAGGVSPPALTLAHEIGHAVRNDLSDGLNTALDHKIPDHDTFEEYGVIARLENNLAAAHGEIQRTDHGGALVETDHVLSTIPSKASTRALLRKMLPLMQEITAHINATEAGQTPRSASGEPGLRRSPRISRATREDILRMIAQVG